MSRKNNYCVIFFTLLDDGETENPQIYRINPKPGAPPMSVKDLESEVRANIKQRLNAMDPKQKSAISRITFCREEKNNIFTICQIYPELKN
ncbi:MAG: hypothetical protein A2469_00325 [Candidatus Magasanikbacteria bacterium RIFOXYC2_FULL_40_16]|uniref:Uncharacterized protein n=3 Tax=Candidatus Magasanikiibacteriota TaxID=1752731 RepID=A0A1F6NHK1_9BACT|nr:MAG: hypothetical protein A2224_00155 [Candidatus Magasanikbacteria bacterium RIFOXYA2_FULL_40_20]OGH83359.1 MAG: hypothetical protein A2373_00075 [Candidatus Magasanikbacteria bacterium RIFOXYB1_FULL_40_15]OGH86828.1 MAG: hypothetical protein A2301_02885 [Candidatus Magasanikbacteria bacterium RIFOXYB2_FULL_40_13]OGH87107.1 MAG: hypothetical protein A2206_01925 [Candidatus Magasanikbacteria bacterium RIFOXYA1_FULL_40_8]OGH90432.1 MAG: hypothetical protein A2469_00325 [Candidatus Magasanikba